MKIILLFNDKFWLPKIKNNYKHKQNWENKKIKSFASLGVGSLLSGCLTSFKHVKKLVNYFNHSLHSFYIYQRVEGVEYWCPQDQVLWQPEGASNPITFSR